MKKINLIKIYEVLRYLVYFLGGALMIKQGQTEAGIGAITLGAATFAKDRTRANELKDIKKNLSDTTATNGNPIQ